MFADSPVGTVRVFRHHVHLAYSRLAILEILWFFCVCYLATWIYYLPEPAARGAYLNDLFWRACLFTVMMSMSMLAMGLYQPRLREGPNGILLRTLSAFVLMTFGMALVFYFLPNLHLWRGIFVLTSLLTFAGVLSLRLVFLKTMQIENLKRRVLILGTGQQASNIARKMRRASDRQTFHIAGYIRLPGEEIAIDTPNILTLDQPLFEYARKHDIQQIVVALEDRNGKLPRAELMQCRSMGVSVVDILDFFEQEASKILVEEATPEWFIFSDGFRCGHTEGLRKRGFDILASFLLLCVTWPVLLLTTLAIKLEDGARAPVIFRQRRVGMNGRVFEVLKLRSMRMDAEGDGKARWATSDDDRITRVGHIIRKLRIDELPQIINVLRGDMSLVGPRPERPEFARELGQEIPFFAQRLRVKPGITGWAQLNYPYGASVADARHKLEFDLYYVKNQSLFLDFLIMLQTVEVVLFGKGAR